MSEVTVGDNESFESALRRFNKKVQQDGILAEARRREFYGSRACFASEKKLRAAARAMLKPPVIPRIFSDFLRTNVRFLLNKPQSRLPGLRFIP